MNSLETMGTKYLPFKKKNWKEMFKAVSKRQSENLRILYQSTLAGVLTGGGLQIKNYLEITPEIKEAFSLAFPNMKLSDLAGKSVEYLDGIEQGWKGKLFEVMVENKLNAGETVGNITLQAGEVAKLATSPTQAEWDLQILDSNNNPIEYLQLKATENQSYITETLEKYPNTEILATSEIEPDEMVSRVSDISDLELEENILDAMDIYVDGSTLVSDFGFGFGTFFGARLIYGWGKNQLETPQIITKQNERMQLLLQASTRTLGFSEKSA